MEEICIFCNEMLYEDYCVNVTCMHFTKKQKFLCLLKKLAVCMSECSNIIENELMNLCLDISMLDIMEPLDLVPLNEFNSIYHKIDIIAKEYLNMCVEINSDIFVPIDSIGDHNCLYSSIRLLVPSAEISTEELRVRTFVELVLNFDYYNEKYLYSLGYLYGSLKDITIMNRFSDGYEVAGLSTGMNWEIKLNCPSLGYTGFANVMSNIFQPRYQRNISVFKIQLLWSHVLSIENAVTVSETGISLWTPNHFVPLLAIDKAIINSSNSVCKIILFN